MIPPKERKCFCGQVFEGNEFVAWQQHQQGHKMSPRRTISLVSKTGERKEARTRASLLLLRLFGR